MPPPAVKEGQRAAPALPEAAGQGTGIRKNEKSRERKTRIPQRKVFVVYDWTEERENRK